MKWEKMVYLDPGTLYAFEKIERCQCGATLEFIKVYLMPVQKSWGVSCLRCHLDTGTCQDLNDAIERWNKNYAIKKKDKK